MTTPDVIIPIVAGPTASGKSAAALDMVQARNGVVINADSMQIYDALPILTAQPSQNDMASAPHALYGTLHANDGCSAARWRDMATDIITQTLDAGKIPIVCGGTGLYISALTEGLSPVPASPPEIRARGMALQRDLGNPGFHAALAARDPEAGARIHPMHSSRLLRAWEVLEATGRSIFGWQRETPQGPPAHWRFEWHVREPDRAALHAAINMRFVKMIEGGALDEVRAFAARIDSGELPENAPPVKAHGFRALRSYLRGTMTLEAAIASAQAETRQYAKRQMTWFRNRV